MIVHKNDYLDKMEKLLNDVHKLKKKFKSDGFSSFAVNQEKQVGNIFKRLPPSNSIIKGTRRSVIPVRTRSSIMYRFCMDYGCSHEDIVDNCSPCQPFCPELVLLTIKYQNF